MQFFQPTSLAYQYGYICYQNCSICNQIIYKGNDNFTEENCWKCTFVLKEYNNSGSLLSQLPSDLKRYLLLFLKIVYKI